MDKESFYEQMKRLGLWDKPIGELANVIDEKDKAIAEKDREIERLKAALNEIATTELICPEMKEKCEYMSDIALKALKEEGDGSTV
jgi:translation elongation factor EF-1alpha